MIDFNNNITICISTHNNLPYLDILIKSIYANSKYDNKVIVYAENCTDGTDVWLKEQCNAGFEYYIEHNDVAKGIGAGINFIIDKVQTEYFILLHSDMVVPFHFDSKLAQFFNTNDNKKIASAWRCEPNIWNNPPQSAGLVSLPIEIFGEYYHNFKYDSFIEWANSFSAQNIGVTIKSISGAGGYMMKKSDWDFIGGNDPLFSPACYEDIDLALRAQIRGFELIMTAEVLIYHFGARGSHFPDDNLNMKSERQIDAERNGYSKWLLKWNDFINYDVNNLIVLTDKMKEHIELNKNKFLY